MCIRDSHCEDALGDTEATECTRRHVIGVHRVCVHLHVAHVVSSCCVCRSAQHHVVAQTGIGPAIAPDFSFVGYDRALLISSSLHSDNRRVSLWMDDERLSSTQYHFYRSLSNQGRKRKMYLDRHIL